MDRRIVKTKQALLDALKGLVVHMDVDRITVSELCERAQINRSTFYKYYASPLDLIEEQLSLFTGQILTPLNHAQTRAEIEAMLLVMFQIFFENRWMKQLFDSTNPSLLLNMQKRLIPYKNLQLERNVLPYFLSGGIAIVTMQWVREGCTIAPERLAREITELIMRSRIENSGYSPTKI